MSSWSEPKRQINWTCRISPETRDRLAESRKTTGVWATVVVNQLIQAYLTWIETAGEVSFPLEVIPKKRLEELLLLEKQHKAKSLGIPS